MYSLKQLSNFIVFVFFIITFKVCVDFIYSLYQLLKNVKFTQDNLKRWKQGIINIDDIHDLTPREFEFWCGEFISNLGYKKIEQSQMGPDGGKDIICFLNDEKTYVECKRYSYSKSAKFIVDVQICKKLVGAMVHDNVLRGIIITSGIIKEDCAEYIRSLPKEYSIELYDGSKIIKEYQELHNA